MQMLIGQGTLDMTLMTPAPIFLQWVSENSAHLKSFEPRQRVSL
jgi:hypothetical protein